MACSQSPLCLLDAASSQALSYVSVWRSMSWESSSWTIGLSQVCCLAGEVNVGISPGHITIVSLPRLLVNVEF